MRRALLPDLSAGGCRFRHLRISGLSAAWSVATLSVATLAWTGAALADRPNVVASIKPVHSLVAGVMGDVGTPHLLVSGADSPHTYAMRPSDAEALSNAEVVFWVGPQLETFLDRPIGNLGSDATAVALIDAPGLTLLRYDDEAEHDEHGHGEHDHDEHGHDEHGHDEDGHDEHAADNHDADDHDADDHDAGHDHAEEHAEEHGHDHDDADAGHDGEHHHTGIDGHIWLDPANARAMVDAIVAALSEADSANATTYRENGKALAARLTALEADTAASLAPYRNVPYFTFHESFGYFDARFGLDGHGAISISPERQPGVQRLQEIRAEISAFDRVCIFAEPQFPPKLVDVIVEGTAARTGTLDPLGASLEPGADLYFALIEADRDAFAACFQSTM